MPYEYLLDSYKLMTIIEKARISSYNKFKYFYYHFLFSLKTNIYDFLIKRKIRKANNEEIMELYEKVNRELIFSYTILNAMHIHETIDGLNRCIFSYQIINNNIISNIYYKTDTDSIIIETDVNINNDDYNIYFVKPKQFNLCIQKLESDETIKKFVTDILLVLYMQVYINMRSIQRKEIIRK